MIVEFVVVNALIALATVVMPFVTAIQARNGARPNNFLGLRTEHTRKSPEAWQAGHRAALPPIRIGFLAAFAIALGGVASAVYGWQGMSMWLAMGSALVAMIATGFGIAQANPAAQAAEEARTAAGEDPQG